MKAPVIETKRLILKPLSLEHLSQDYVDWLNDPDVNKYLESGGNYTLEMLKDFLTEVEKKDIYFWAIHSKENNLHIGNNKMDPINLKHGLAEYGIMMGRKSEWGKGYAYEVSEAVIGYCFEKLNIRKITCGIVDDNASSLKLVERLGFEVEGKYKQHGLYQGRYCDIFRLALFNPALRNA